MRVEYPYTAMAEGIAVFDHIAVAWNVKTVAVYWVLIVARIDTHCNQ
jgi:hypothetical protein